MTDHPPVEVYVGNTQNNNILVIDAAERLSGDIQSKAKSLVAELSSGNCKSCAIIHTGIEFNGHALNFDCNQGME